MKDIRTGVVGVGHLGYHHARIHASLEGTTLAGVVDTDPEQRARAERDFGVPAYGRVEELLDAGVDAVSVVTPTMTHAVVALKLIHAGVHLLVEKPIAPTIKEAEQITAEAARQELVLQVGHVERFNGAVIAFMKAIEAPLFIECHRLSPYSGRSKDVSVVLDLMIHDIDIVMALVNSELVSIDAVGVSILSEQEDIANVRMRFASGCVANLTSSRISIDKIRKIRIFESNAYLSTDYGAQEVTVYRKKPGAISENEDPMSHISIESLPVEKDEPLKLELASFIDAVRHGVPPVVSGEDGVRAVRVAQQVVDCIREHS